MSNANHPQHYQQATGIEAEICNDIAKRQKIGLSKYGVSVADNPLPLIEWLNHAYEETLDQAVYLKKAIEKIKKDLGVSNAES